MKGCLSLESNSRSLRTEWMLFFWIIFVLCISFIAYTCPVFLSLTLHTLPKPPFPMIYWQSKWSLETYPPSNSFYSWVLNLDKSILKQFLIYFVDFLEIVELLRLCSFDFLFTTYLLYLVSCWIFTLPVATPPPELLILCFLNFRIYT